MTRRADAILPHRDAPRGGDLRRHLRCRQQTAEARFGALRELDLDCPHRRRRDDVFEALEIEATVLIATSEVRGADLEHEIAAVTMMGRQAALTGVVRATSEGGSTVERLDGRTRE